MKATFIAALFALSFAVHATEQDDPDVSDLDRDVNEEQIIDNLLFAKEELLYVEPSEDEDEYFNGIIPQAEDGM